MADNIRTYTAPDRTLHPDEKGFAAFETAGRRIGPLYNQAAQDYRSIGSLQAHEIRGRLWPFDLLALQGRGGVSVRIRDGSSRGSRGSPDGSDSDPIGQVAAGAGALGNYMSGTADSGPSGGQLVDVSAGTSQIGRTGKITSSYDPARMWVGNATAPSTIGAPSSDFDPLSQDIQRAQGNAGIESEPLAPPPGYSAAPVAQPDTSSGWFSGLSDWLGQSFSNDTGDLGGQY